MNGVIPDGYRHEPHAPDMFVLRCPDCGETTTSDTRTSKHGRACIRCGRLRGVTPVSKTGNAEPENHEVTIATDGGHTIVGPNDEPTEPEHECANCGATYYGRGAALECCSDDVRTDGGQLQQRSKGDDEQDRPDPTDLHMHQLPAYVQRSGIGNRFVADYSILDSGWVRTKDWDGSVVKFPPHEVMAVREVQTDHYGERGSDGLRRRRLADSELIEEAREKGAQTSGVGQ